MIITLLTILHIGVCAFLMLVVLLQQGKGGGMGAAFGGTTQQVFGGRGAGNILTRATAVCAALFMLTSIGLAYKASEGDRDLKAKVVEEQRKGKGNEGTKVKQQKPKPSATVPAPMAPPAPPPTPPTDSAPGTGGQ
jgi:preprotein translocase subunit SecG